MHQENTENFNQKCVSNNIQLFAKYVRGDLVREEERILDSHIQSCQECLFNFAYVEEIFEGKQDLSIEEKTLLVKYLRDPIWKDAIEKAKQEMLEEAKMLLTAPSVDNNTFLEKFNDKTAYTNINKNTYNYINKAIPFYKKPYVFAATFTAVFFALTLVNTFMIFHSQINISSFLNPITKISTVNKTIGNSLYQELDKSIDTYLSSKNTSHLENAQSIAQELKEKYTDYYGIDLVSYYKSIPPSRLDTLSNYRKEMFDLINQPVGDKYEERLKRSQKLEKNFLEFGNKVEACRAKTLISKSQLFLYTPEEFRATTREGLKFSRDNKYLFLEGYFLLWQAKHLSETSGFEESEKAFLQTLEVGQKIQLEDIITSSNVSLVTLYHLNSDDQKCLDTTQTLLSSPQKIKKDRMVSLMQVAGLAAANLNDYKLARNYLEDSLKLSEELQNSFLLTKSYTFLSLVSAKQSDFSGSKDYYLKSLKTLDKIEDVKSKAESKFITLGYQGKIKFLEGNFSQSVKAYQQALAITKDLKMQNNLYLSQINEGLAVANKELKNYKEANQYFATANYYSNLARDQKQMTNCLLSFVPNPCR